MAPAIPQTFSTFNIPPTRRHVDTIDFLLGRPSLELLPEALRPSARSFLSYLATLPASAPHQCPACASRSISLAIPAGSRGLRRDGYYCRNCNKRFNVLSGTPLRLLRSEDKWKPWMSYRFQGFSQELIATFLGISNKASMTWSRAFMEAMADYDADLHRWWEDHQSTQVSELTDEVEEALEACVAALAELTVLTDRHCPYCGSSSNQVLTSRRATEYQCHGCGRRYNNLTETPLSHIQHKELWPEYLRLLVVGYHDTEIGERLGLSKSLTNLWRQRFLEFMQPRWPLLAHWTLWQWSRRRASSSGEPLP
ncbi:hypothetical protein [Salinicola lusitanus]|uniref:IS1 family transposase n=1 Tax=Salinicola lusitanus TaxID=1949085 RepID=A0ABZ3CVT4_9GAMM|nr:hypothetical protein [Salinicola lusitanus]